MNVLENHKKEKVEFHFIFSEVPKVSVRFSSLTKFLRNALN
jgi:hypothetical protein